VSRPKADDVIAFRAPAHLVAQLRVLADAESNGVSAVARRLLTAALAREGRS
jgi:hypothetical protein